jgi:hypothetical protein
MCEPVEMVKEPHRLLGRVEKFLDKNIGKDATIQ